MFPGFDRIIEERIRRAQQKGKFEDLEGTGKPLIFEKDGHVAGELRLAYKILKNADCLPPEIQLKNEIKRTEDLLSGMEDTAEKYRTLKKLNFLIMKLNSLGNLPIDLEMPQKYSVKVLERMEASRKNKKNLKSHKG
ncbi:MAG: DUF1992 domain-containing protein [Deltaproteobacteria bacterium]|jgi:hypothetical protein|nr:DUF1992 domain-containing protein [Deltaproteobacteria bacterium]